MSKIHRFVKNLSFFLILIFFSFQMLKVLVDNAYQLTEPHPNTLFCLLEYDGNRLTTSHNPVEGGRVRYNEEAEFTIKKPGNLRIQLCSVEGKPGLLSLEASIFMIDQFRPK